MTTYTREQANAGLSKFQYDTLDKENGLEPFNLNTGTKVRLYHLNGKVTECSFNEWLNSDIDGRDLIVTKVPDGVPVDKLLNV